MPAARKPRAAFPKAAPVAPSSVAGKRSHHKVSTGKRKHRKVSSGSKPSSSSSTTYEKPELVIKVPRASESLNLDLLDTLDGENSTDSSLSAETDYYSDDDDDDDDEVDEGFREEYSYAGSHDRSLADEQESLMHQVDESEVDDSYGAGPGSHLLDDFNLDNEPDSSHEIPTSGDSHLPAPYAWTDPQHPVEEPVSMDDPEGVANGAGAVSSWDAEAEAAVAKRTTLTLKKKDPERDEDTPQVDRNSRSPSGNDPSQLRLDMSTSSDFFANPEQGEYMHDILPTPRRRSHEEMVAVRQNDPMNNWVPAKYRS